MHREPTIATERQGLLEAGRRLRALAERRGVPNALPDLDGAAARLRANTFRLSVLGEYKRGKSTLINALLGRPVLPMGVVPLTSVVTEVRFDAEAAATIEFSDGRSRHIPTDALPDFVTEPGNPRNRLGVRGAIVHDPAAFLAEGVVVRDTPGIGSALDHNTRLTYDSLDESDAVVMVLAADQPLSANELALLAALSDVTDRILFAVNRADLLTQADLAVAVRYIADLLGEAGHPPEHVFAISARSALEARAAGHAAPPEFDRFAGALHRVLIERKSSILAHRARLMTRRAADLLALRFETEIRASKLAEADLEGAIREFQVGAVRIADRVDQAAVLFRHRVRKIHEIELKRMEEAETARCVETLWPSLECTLRSEGPHRDGGWADRVALDVGRSAVAALRPLYRLSELLVQEEFDRALTEYIERIEGAFRETVDTANRLLGMRAEVLPVAVPLSDRPRFYYHEWDGAGGQLRGSSLWLRLPWRLGGARVVRQFRELLERRVRQNLAAIHYDWVTRLEEAARALGAANRAQSDAAKAMVLDALQRARGAKNDPARSARLLDLQSDADAVRAIAGSLRAMGELADPGTSAPVPGVTE